MGINLLQFSPLIPFVEWWNVFAPSLFSLLLHPQPVDPTMKRKRRKLYRPHKKVSLFIFNHIPNKSLNLTEKGILATIFKWKFFFSPQYQILFEKVYNSSRENVSKNSYGSSKCDESPCQGHNNNNMFTPWIRKMTLA